MAKLVEAVYEEGLFRPREPVSGLQEHQRVKLLIQTEEELEGRVAETLRLARESLESLSSEQLAIVEEARLDQERFFGPGNV